MASHPPPLPSSSPSPSPSPSLSKPPRRVPPPCWTHEETLALIESYHEKWYSLRRGNLKASHWQEVADAVARRCRFVTPSKTCVQCRHKIEKLRKRYRTEKQRAANANAPPNRFSSSWNFFKKMDDMERGPLAAPLVDSDEEDDDNDEENNEDDDDDNDDDEEDRDPVVNNVHPINYHRMITNGSGSGSGSGGSGSGGGGAFKFRIPGGSRAVPSPTSASPLGVTGSVRQNNNYGRYDESPDFKPNHNSNSSPNPRFFSNSVPRSGSGRGDGIRSGVKREMDPVADMVSSIRMLGEGFVRMEQKKIEMAKEMEQMRMEMEMKRTQMILESQQMIVEAFANGMSGRKKSKRMPTPE